MLFKRKPSRHRKQSPATPPAPRPVATLSAPPQHADTHGATRVPTGTMHERPATTALLPVHATIRAALADIEGPAVIPAVPACGPVAVTLPPHEHITVDAANLWRPPVSESAAVPDTSDLPAPTWWDDLHSPADWPQDMWGAGGRVESALGSPNLQWFRDESRDTVRNDLSLRAFHNRFADPSGSVVLNGGASPRTMTFVMREQDEFAASGSTVQP